MTDGDGKKKEGIPLTATPSEVGAESSRGKDVAAPIRGGAADVAADHEVGAPARSSVKLFAEF